MAWLAKMKRQNGNGGYVSIRRLRKRKRKEIERLKGEEKYRNSGARRKIINRRKKGGWRQPGARRIIGSVMRRRSIMAEK